MAVPQNSSGLYFDLQQVYMYEEGNPYMDSQKNFARSCNSSKSLCANTDYYKLDRDSMFLDDPDKQFFVLMQAGKSELWSYVPHDKLAKPLKY